MEMVLMPENHKSRSSKEFIMFNNKKALNFFRAFFTRKSLLLKYTYFLSFPLPADHPAVEEWQVVFEKER